MTLVSRRTALKLGLAGSAFALTSPAWALVEIVVTGGNFTPLPIAIPDFASSDPAFGREIADIVRNNLKRSGLFAPLDPASLPIQVGDVTNERSVDVQINRLRKKIEPQPGKPIYLQTIRHAGYVLYADRA